MGMNVMNNDKLIFNNVSFIVKDKNNLEKVILDNISGNVSSGEMLGILGPSGAGKTTLLNVLTHNTNSGKSFGKILYNNSEISSRFLMEECYIVNHQDFHWPFLTCRETIE